MVYLQKRCMMGIEEKTPKYTKDETKEKIPCLVVLQSPRLRSGGRLFLVSENTENKPGLP